MSKKIESLQMQIDATYIEQAQIYTDILAMCIDPAAATAMLRHLEANIVRRQNLQRDLDKEAAKPATIFDQFFGPR